MNINVFGRLVSSLQCAPACCSTRLPRTYNDRILTKEIYQKELSQDVGLFYNGMNVSLIVMGDSMSSKYSTVFGNHCSQDGLLPLFMEQVLFYKNQKKAATEEKVLLSWFEIDDLEIVDVLNNKSRCQLEETPEEGVIIPNLTTFCIPNVDSMVGVIKCNLNKLNKNRASFVEITLNKPRQNGALATKSKFMITVLPISPTFSEDNQPGMYIHGSGAIIDYSGSKLTMMMKEILGGNSKTSVLICIRQDSSPPLNAKLLDLAATLSKIQNFPIINTEFARKLLCCMRAQILTKSDWICGQKKMSPLLKTSDSFACNFNNNTFAPDLCNNSVVCCNNLHPSGDLPCYFDFNPFKTSTINPSMDLDYLSEESRKILSQNDCTVCLDDKDAEKLSMMDMLNNLKLENERLSEERGELRHQYYVDKKQLECRMKNLEQEVEQNCGLLSVEKQKNFVLERDWEAISIKFDDLMAKHSGLIKAFKQQIAQLEQQKMEIEQIVDFPCSDMTNISSRLRSMAEDICFIINNSSAQISSINEESKKCPIPPAPPKCFDSDSSVPIVTHEKIQRNLQEHINSLNQELIGSKHTNRELQKKISKFTAKLIIMEKEKNFASLEIKQLQNRLKEMALCFKRRILCYIHERFTYKSACPDGFQAALDDINACHLEKEKHLNSLICACRDKYQDILSRHEKLLAAYKDIYTQVKHDNLADQIDLGLIEEYLRLPVNRDGSCINILHGDLMETQLCKGEKQNLLDKSTTLKKEIEDIQRRINKGLNRLQNEKQSCSPLPSNKCTKNKVSFINDFPKDEIFQLPDIYKDPRLQSSPNKYKPFIAHTGGSCLVSLKTRTLGSSSKRFAS